MAADSPGGRWPLTRVLPPAAISLLLVLLAVVIARTAWTSDDAYITFRTIDNLLHGYGPRWNVAERVQSYTHPLWLLLLTPIAGLTGNIYLAALALSAGLTAAAVAMVLVGTRGRPWQTVGVLTALVLSKAFTDYSTSGLENALSHALLAALMLVTAQPLAGRRRAVLAGTLVGLAGMTRLDLLLLASPIGLARLRAPRRTMPAFALGLLPLVAWEVFSIVYYGVPFPNTAYAKLGTGVTHAELWIQGLSYYLDSINRDPVTLFVIGGAVTAALATGRGARVPALAVVMYLVYVARIGGDFMSGRFLTAPLVVSLCLFARMPWTDASAGMLTAVGATLALGLSTANPTVFAGSGYSTPASEIGSDSGIVDERGYYFQNSGWLTAHGARWRPENEEIMAARLAGRTTPEQRVFAHGMIGMIGYHAGPDIHIVDVFALCDPLLARLPARRPWRIGHYERDPPSGYLESVRENRNLIDDPHVASLYAVLRIVTRDPLWSGRRWRAIWALNSGRTDGWAVDR